MQITVKSREQIEFENVWHSSSICDGLVIKIAGILHNSTHKTQMLLPAILLCSEVKLEANRSGWTVGKINKVPGDVGEVPKKAAVIAAKSYGWACTSVETRVVCKSGKRERSLINEERIPRYKSVQTAQLSAAHARNGGDIEFHIIQE